MLRVKFCNIKSVSEMRFKRLVFAITMAFAGLATFFGAVGYVQSAEPSQPTKTLILASALIIALFFYGAALRGKLALPSPDEPVDYPRGENGLWYARFEGKNICKPDHAIEYRDKNGQVRKADVELLEFWRRGFTGAELRAWCNARAIR